MQQHHRRGRAGLQLLAPRRGFHLGAGCAIPVDMTGWLLVAARVADQRQQVHHLEGRDFVGWRAEIGEQVDAVSSNGLENRITPRARARSNSAACHSNGVCASW